MGKSWRRVARAVRMRETWIIRVRSLPVMPQVLQMMMAGVMTPTMAATTCCIPRGMTFPMGGMPSIWNTLAGCLFVSFDINTRLTH